MKTISLVELFEANEQKLKKGLAGLCLPQDAKKIQDVVDTYFEEVLDRENPFKQHLTQSEEYILDAAMTLLDSQQLMYGNITHFEVENPNSQLQEENSITEEETNKVIKKGVLVGAAAGIGGAVLGAGSWGTLFITIAAASITFYIATKKLKKNEDFVQDNALPEFVGTEINVDEFVSIIRNVCEKIDNLINTFRAQIKQVKNYYENQEKISLEKDYKLLLGSIQSMLGTCYSDESNEKYWPKLKERVEDVGEILENYGIKVVMYSSEVKSFFDVVYRENIDNPNMIYPAFVKDGIAVMKGKVVLSK